MGLAVITAPAVEPVSATEAKLHLRVDHSEDDTYIGGLITMAREYVEGIKGRALITQTLEQTLDGFPSSGGPIRLSRPPLQSVTSVTYHDADGATSTVLASSVYYVDTVSHPGRLVLHDGESWPSDTLRPGNGVVVRYVAGYGTAATAVPEIDIHLCKLLVTQFYQNREPVVVGMITSKLPLGLEALLEYDRIWEFA